MASLDFRCADDQMVQVMLCYGGKNYLLCSLKNGSTYQVPLDLNFQKGTKIAFTCNGNGHVHLTGYLILDEDLDLDELEEEEEDEEEQAPQLVKQSKRKAADSLKSEMKRKRPKQEIMPESSDDDDDELEIDGTKELDGSDEEQEEFLLNDEDASEEEEEENEDEEEEEEEEQEQKVSIQQKDKKNKQTQQQQQRKKEDKKKLVNGKEAKQEEQLKQKKNKGEQQQQNTQSTQSEEKKRVVEGGVQVEDLKIGNGTLAKAGKFVSVYYVGRLKNGMKFDSTTQGKGFKFRLGKGEVIKGWDIGIAGMKVGGKRRVTIPPAMAYGAKGSPPVIPGNSTLVFEIELRNVH